MTAIFYTFGFAGLPFNATYTDRVINHDVDVQQTHPAKGRLFFDEYFGANSNLGYDERVMLLSPDESQLYTVGYDGDHVGVFRRDVATGIPSHIDTVAWCCGIDPQQGDHTSQSRPCLPTGRNGARLTPQAGPFRWASTVPNGIVNVSVVPGQSMTQNFGSRPLPSSIAGVVWMDNDRNGVRDPGELGVAGVILYLDQNGNGVLDTTERSTVSLADDPATTMIDETGRYLFDNLGPGDYLVRQILPGGYTQTAPSTVSLQLAERTLTDFVYNGFQHHPEDDLRISADGRYLVFATTKQMLPEDSNARRDVYLVDRLTQQTELISVNSDEMQGNANHFEPDVSEDGRFVIFRSGSTNLDPADTGGSHDIYIRDRMLGTTELLSKGPTGGPAGGHTADALISPDGQRVSFFSLGNNLVIGDTNATHDTFLLDRSTGLFQRVNVNFGADSGSRLQWSQRYFLARPGHG